ncbi:MAG: BrnT family toxin [Thermodesulfobacteriota bacterium]
MTIFDFPMTITVDDPDHSQDEERRVTIGVSPTGRFLLVVHTNRGDRIRTISARDLTRAEREAYHHRISRRTQR